MEDMTTDEVLYSHGGSGSSGRPHRDHGDEHVNGRDAEGAEETLEPWKGGCTVLLRLAPAQRPPLFVKETIELNKVSARTSRDESMSAKYQFEVDMACGACSNAINKVLTKMPGECVSKTRLLPRAGQESGNGQFMRAGD